MPASLQDLYAALTAALANDELTLTADNSGPPEIGGFIAGLTGQVLTLQQAAVRLTDQQPATLVVSGTVGDSWPLPGMSQTSVQVQTVTITYSQASPNAEVTASLAVTATLTVGQHVIGLSGLLGADGSLALAWNTTQGGTLTLADAANVASDGQAGALVPQDLPPFSSLGLTALALSFCYAAGAYTLMQFTLDAEPGATWDIIPGQHVLEAIGVTVSARYQRLALGYRSSFGASVYATLNLGRDFQVTVGLAPNSSIWTIDVVPAGGLPALETVGQLAGLGDQVADGLQAIGLGDITLESVSIGVNSSDSSLAYIAATGTLSLLGKVINVSVELPVFQFGGWLSDQTPLSLTDLLESMLGSAAGMPEVEITELVLTAIPQVGYYSLAVTVADGAVTAGKYGVSEVAIELEKDSSGVTGGLTGTIVLGSAQLILAAEYLGQPTGWSFDGELTSLGIGDLITELSSTYGITQIPEPIKTLELTKVSVAYQSGSGNFAFDLEAGFTVADTPVSVTVTVTVMPSIQAPPPGANPHVAVTQGTAGYSATFTGQISFAGLQFDIVFNTADSGTDVLVADYVHTNADPIELQALVAGVSASLAQAIPPGISVDLEEVKFVFLKQTTSVWAFGLRLGTQINLSQLPIVGSKLPPEATLAIQNLQILYASADLTAAQTSVINPLLPGGVVKLPGAVGEGIAFDADVQLGTVSEHLHAGVTPPAAPLASPRAARPAAGGALPQVTAPAAAVPASSTDPVNWLEVNKQFGIFSFKRVGTGYQDNVLLFALDASVALGPIAFSMQALTVGSSLAQFEPEFSLKGLALTFDQPPVAIGGAFLKTQQTVAGKEIDSYYGEVIVSAGNFSLLALGGWAPDADPASFFLYVSVDYPLGGPPFLFVTGLAGGFGINSRLILPTIDQVGSFPLLPGNAPAEQGSPAQTISVVIPALQGTFQPQAGAYWVAAGISFTSFEMIEATAVISVLFGVDLQIGVIGTCAMTFPTGDPNPVAYVEIDVVASFTPSTGLLAVDGKLSPASYLFGGYVKLTGGFAFYAWFAGDDAGDFVVSLGGYHPAFDKPANYPAVPRLALAFACGPVKVTGQAYFALTPGMFMAGLRMSATFEAGPVKAWFDTGVDFLIAWAPFHYEADAWVTIGCSVDLGLFTLSVQVGADLQIWGPEFGGQAQVDLDVVSFTIGFGAAATPPAPVGWQTFATNFLPPPDSAPAAVALLAHAATAAAAAARVATATATAEDPVPNVIKATVASGQLPQTATGVDWILDPNQFRIVTASTIPANHGLWSTSPTETAELPNDVGSYQRAAAPPAVAADRAAAPPPAQMLLQLDHATVTYPDGPQVWAPVLNVAPMGEIGVASYHTVALRRRDENGALTEYVTGVTVAPQLSPANTALWGDNAPGDPNVQRLIDATLTGFAISPVPRHPNQVSDVPLLALLFGEGSSTGFSYQLPGADQQFTVTSSISSNGETLTIGVAGGHTAMLPNQGYALSALTDPWVTGQRTATLDELRQLGFSTAAGEAVQLDTLADTALTDWPAVARIGLEAWA